MHPHPQGHGLYFGLVLPEGGIGSMPGVPLPSGDSELGLTWSSSQWQAILLQLSGHHLLQLF